jgi:hypothetical protein
MWIFIVLEYDEMNCTIIFGIKKNKIKLQCILKCRFWLYAITMNLMWEWNVVLTLLKLKIKIWTHAYEMQIYCYSNVKYFARI